MSSEQLPPRRQPPSPLVFSPETALLPAPAISQAPPSKLDGSSTVQHDSGSSNTVSMPFVRRHVTRRLKTAKAECDKDLQRVTNSITAFFEERLREGDHEREAEREARQWQADRDRDVDSSSQYSDMESLRDAFSNIDTGRSALMTDDMSSEGGYEAELESTHHSRQGMSMYVSKNSLTCL